MTKEGDLAAPFLFMTIVASKKVDSIVGRIECQ